MIKNLSQLKKAIANKQKFLVLEHYVHPEYMGQTRVPTRTGSTVFYSITPYPSDISNANSGDGLRNEFGKASDWEFHEDGTITQFHTWTPYNREPERCPVMKIKFIDE